MKLRKLIATLLVAATCIATAMPASASIVSDAKAANDAYLAAVEEYKAKEAAKQSAYLAAVEDYKAQAAAKNAAYEAAVKAKAAQLQAEQEAANEAYLKAIFG